MRKVWLSLCLLAAWPGVGYAQQPAAPAPSASAPPTAGAPGPLHGVPAPPPPPPLPVPVVPAPTAIAAASLPELPVTPPVDDPMLAPVPPPRRVLTSWSEAYQLLQSRSTNLRTAIDQVAEAEGQTIVAFAQYLPAFGGCAGGSSAPPGCINGTFTHQLLTHRANEVVTGEPTTSVLPIPNTASMSMTMSQDILNVQEFDQIFINKMMEDQSRLSVEDTRRTLEFGLANQIVSVVTAERSAEINRVGLRVALEELALTRRKEALGAAMSLDVVRAQQNAANARVALVNGDEALRQAREALGLALSIPEETGVAPDMKVDGIAQQALQACHAIDTIDARPDVEAARKSLEVAKRNLQNTWYSFIPVITAQSSIAATTAVNNGYPNPTWSIGAAVSFPIFDGGTRYGTIKTERAAADVASQSLQTLRYQAIIQVEQAQRGIQVAEASYRVALEQRDLAAENDTLTKKLWVRGQGTSVDLVTASAAHREAEQSLVVAEFGVVKARLAAIMALSTCPS